MNDNPGDKPEENPDGPESGGQNPFKGTPFEQLFGSGGFGGMPGPGGIPGLGGMPDLGQLFHQIQSLMQPHDGGRGVDGLDYSAHPTALDRMREVCERIAQEYDVHGVAAVHRTGTLAIGDVAVVVATTAAHRGEAFAASKALIDTLKAETPIWKHQRFGDGSDEWVGTP